MCSNNHCQKKRRIIKAFMEDHEGESESKLKESWEVHKANLRQARVITEEELIDWDLKTTQ